MHADQTRCCRLEGNSQCMAKEAVENLVLLEPFVDGHYVLLSNIYAQPKMWDGVRRTRKLLRSECTERIPGSSSIQVDNAVYEFVTGDKSHPRCDEIYQMVDEMIDKLEKAGYNQ